MNTLPEETLDDSYARDRAAAEDDGTALLERTDDRPPVDLYHAAVALADTLHDDLADALEYIGLPDIDPSRWESLDVARAADYVRRTYPDRFPALSHRFPWLPDVADRAIGALADAF